MQSYQGCARAWIFFKAPHILICRVTSLLSSSSVAKRTSLKGFLQLGNALSQEDSNQDYTRRLNEQVVLSLIILQEIIQVILCTYIIVPNLHTILSNTPGRISLRIFERNIFCKSLVVRPSDTNTL